MSNPMNPVLTAWDITFGGVSFGLINEVDPTALKLTMKPIKRGTTGDMILGHFITGLEGLLKVKIPDLSPAMVAALTPWSTTVVQAASAAFALPPASIPLNAPAPNIDLYEYAQVLSMHPHYLGADLSKDLNFTHALPMSPFKIKRSGENQDEWDVEFFFYPDRASLIAVPPVTKYGFLGPAI